MRIGSGDTYRLSGRREVSAPIISPEAMKKYSANTTISVSVSLPNGGYTRISFSPLSDGTSVYYTDDEEIQHALEHHYKFGKLFSLAEVSNALAAKKPTKATARKQPGKSNKRANPEREPAIPEVEAEEPETDEESEGEEEEEGAEMREVSVSDLDAAKDYLAENFDIVRTKLKTEEIINETAASLGVVFKYL